MRINELTRKSVVFLGVLDIAGSFVPYGTGFIALWEQDDLFFTYLVTAKHVIDDMKASKRPLACRINAKNGGAFVGQIEVEHWVTHTSNAKCDITVASFLGSFDTFEIRGIDLLKNCLTESYITENDIGCGDGVFTAGLLVKHLGLAKNIPIVRIGNISAMPEEPIDLGNKLGQQEVYLIESRLGGLSGSPVFLQTPPWRVINGLMINTVGHQREYIMGVNIGLFETKAHGDKLATDTADRREHFLEAMNAGIAVVVPIQRTIEIIRDSPFFQEGRRIFMKQRDENGDFLQTSAKPTIRAVDVDDGALKTDRLGKENPNHLEDFSRLVDMAARTRPQGDQS